MNFQEKLNEIKEFFYISIARYNMSNQFMEMLQKKYPISSDEKPFLIGDKPPEENIPDFETSIGEFKSLIKKHERILVKNCIILLVILWEEYCSKYRIEKYYDENISEIILYRNCIVHNKGIIDSNYLKNSKLKKYQIGNILNFSNRDFKKFLSYFEGK